MGKKEKFEKLLRDAGVSEYWCDRGFDPDEDYPYVTIVLPVKNYKLANHILNLYNDYINFDDDKLNCQVDLQEVTSKFFKTATKSLEKRVLVR